MTVYQSIKLQEIRMNFVESPGPGPRLVILHGFSGSHSEFLHLLPELSRMAHVYIVDLRGHGLSGRAQTGYHIEDYRRDVIEFMHRVVRKPFVLIGHSLGGVVAASLAAAYPHWIQGLLMEEPPLFLLQGSRFRQSGFYDYFVSLRSFLKSHSSGAIPTDEAINFVTGGASITTPRQQKAVRERAIQLQQLDPAALEPVVSSDLLGGIRTDELLEKVQCPVHLLAARVESGSAISSADVQRISRLIPGLTYRRIADSGHDIHLDQPRIYLKELSDFLTRSNIDKQKTILES